MRWLADDASMLRWSPLRSAGHDVLYLADFSAGVSDTEAIGLAEAQNRVLLTEDKDFGELVFRFRMAVPGLVLLRIDPTRSHLKWPRLQAIIGQIGHGLVGRYVVVTETRARSRALERSP